MIWIADFPLPPSVNEYLMPVAGKLQINKHGKYYRQGHLTKTKTHKQYSELVTLWAMQHRVNLDPVKEFLMDLKFKSEFYKQPFCLRVDCFFAFEHSRIYTIQNKVAQLDADNRLKPMRDALSTVLGIDDKHFFSGLCEKVTTRSKDLECAVLRIEQMKPRTLEEIKLLMRQEANTPVS